MELNSQVPRGPGVWPDLLDDSNSALADKQRLGKDVQRLSLTTLKKIYTKYLDRVRAGGFEPRSLFQGIEIARDGPSGLPRDFWTLLAVRDRIILEANALLGITVSPAFVWANRYVASIPFALGLVSISTWFNSQWSRPGLESLIAKVTNWEDVNPTY